MYYRTDRLVAISTLMFPLGSNPSSWLINSNMVLCTSLSPPAPSSNRAPPMASTSSKKMMHAFFPLAISNSSRTIRAPSPTYFCTSSDPITRMKVASVRLATARAQSVLPVPGGPKSRTPFGGSMPSLTNLSGCVKVNELDVVNQQSNVRILKVSPQLHGVSQFALCSLRHRSRLRLVSLQLASL